MKNDIDCPYCEDGKLTTEERDTFPKQWVICSECDLEVQSFYANEDIMNAFHKEKESQNEKG